jgi:hypothetical protein
MTVRIQPRRLAAIDIALLGRPLILAEFAAGVLLGVGLGAFVLLRSRSATQVALGVYFVTLGINYAPMLLHALAIKDRETACAEIADELENKQESMAKYSRQSIYLLVPLVAPVITLRDYWRGSR